jgi:hypothetical protein
LNKKVKNKFGNKKPDELFEKEVLAGAKQITCAYQDAVDSAKQKLSLLQEDTPQYIEAIICFKIAEDMLAFGMTNDKTSEAGINYLRLVKTSETEIPDPIQIYF